MTNSVTDNIIMGCANIGMSRAMIADAVAIIGSFHEIIPWEENINPVPSGDYGFMLRYEDICHGSSITYIHQFSYHEDNITGFWHKHQAEILEYCKELARHRAYRGEKSAAQTVENLMYAINRGGKADYVRADIETALNQADDAATNPTHTEIRKYAVACVLDDVAKAYKQTNG